MSRPATQVSSNHSPARPGLLSTIDRLYANDFSPNEHVEPEVDGYERHRSRGPGAGHVQAADPVDTKLILKCSGAALEYSADIHTRHVARGYEAIDWRFESTAAEGRQPPTDAHC